MIGNNLEHVKNQINDVCNSTQREVQGITLIAVSKTKPVSMLEEAYQNGCRDFGENKVQELVDKYERLPKDIRWHMIGHLQRNKVKYLIGKTYLIHSVDSYRLAEEISREAVKKSTEVNILIEVNIALEDTKFGVLPKDTCELIRQISHLPNIKINGLMTVAPYTDEQETNLQYFAALRDLSVDIKSKNIDNVNMNVLSMGMSGDYTVAIQEGATMIRVGTGIFGERDYLNN